MYINVLMRQKLLKMQGNNQNYIHYKINCQMPKQSLPNILILFSILVAYSVCQICGSSQYFNGQHCAPCRQNCICSSLYGCDSCMVGYTYDSTYTNCIACPTSSNNSKIVNSTSGIVNVGCTSCCSKVKQTQFVCASCPSIPYVHQVYGQCLLIIGCRSVNTNGVCVVCDNNYYIRNGICMLCDISCSTCIDSTFCVTCAPSYYLPATNTNYALCMPCSNGCKTCTSPTLCTQCTIGYRLANSSCTVCNNNCNNCTATLCTNCTVGYALINGSCYNCNNTIYGGSIGCLSCYTFNNVTIKCNVNNCTTGYYYNATTSKCVACNLLYANSILCTPNHALQCKDDYSAVLTSRYYLVNGQCVPNANLCKTMRDSSGLCSQCYFEFGQYYQLVGGVCVKCNIVGCATYSQSCACLQCQSGYQFVNSQCIACQNLYCLACQVSVKACEVCAPYYGLSASACVQCLQSSCLNCDGDVSQCTSCQQGYYNGKGVCYKCQATCQSCISSTHCNLCANGYYLVLGRCKSLPTNCLTVNSNGYCTLCEYGYYILQGICIVCSPTLFNMNKCQNFCPIYYAQLQLQSKLLFTLLLLILLTSILYM